MNKGAVSGSPTMIAISHSIKNPWLDICQYWPCLMYTFCGLFVFYMCYGLFVFYMLYNHGVCDLVCVLNHVYVCKFVKTCNSSLYPKSNIKERIHLSKGKRNYLTQRVSKKSYNCNFFFPSIGKSSTRIPKSLIQIKGSKNLFWMLCKEKKILY